MKLSILSSLGAQVARDGEFSFMAVMTTLKPGSLIFAENEKWLIKALKSPLVTAVIVPEALSCRVPETVGMILAPDPRGEFYRLHNRLDEVAEVLPHKPSRFGSGCKISPLAYVDPENVVLGDHVEVQEFVTIYGPAVIGDHSILRAGVRIGSDGFQFPRDATGKILHVRHYGGVVIGADAEIRENTVINKGLFPGDVASIGDNTKVDAQCYIAHNVHVGSRCLIGPGVQICGSSTVGDRVWIGPQALISSELNIGDEAQIVMGAIVISNVKPGKKVSGNFAVDHEQHLRNCIR